MSDRVAEDAVGPDRREQQGDEGVKDREERGRSSGDQARVDTGFHRLDVVDRQLGIDRSHDALQGAAERVWFERRSRDHEEGVVEPLGIRVVHGAKRVLFSKPVLFHGTDNSHHGIGLVVRAFLRPDEQPLSDRVALRPVTPGEIVVHHAYVRAPSRIVGRQQAALRHARPIVSKYSPATA